MEQCFGYIFPLFGASCSFEIPFRTGLSSEEEGVDLHGLDGDGEALFNLESVVDERERHLLDAVAEEFRVELLQANLQRR